MEHTWRWFGPADPITLAEVRQTGATGVVSALHHVPNGQVWPLDEIVRRRAEIEDAGLRWSVVESVPVHEHIKRGGPLRDEATRNYVSSVRNLAEAGIDTVCYNFMPVIDWTRTDLSRPLPTGGAALAFDYDAYAAFDLHVLEREGAEASYSDDDRDAAAARFRAMSPEDRAALTRTILAGLPGAEESYTLDGFRAALASYAGVDRHALQGNLFAFLEDVLPAAQEAGVRLAIHPDDPPRPLFGLPRIMSSADDIAALLRAHPSPANGITLCVGSYASDPANDVSRIARTFASRVYFAHLRNVRVDADRRSFVESDHLDGDVDMVDVIGTLLREEDRRSSAGEEAASIALRPDHGHRLLDDAHRETRPGYPLTGRMKGLSQLAGVERAVRAHLDGVRS